MLKSWKIAIVVLLSQRLRIVCDNAHNYLGIILSLGTPGQGGLNHVNLHDNQYLIDIFSSLGYEHYFKIITGVSW